MTNDNQTKTDKKTYTKPQVTEVRLVAGEAVLSTCKNNTGGITACVAAGDTSCVSSTPHS
jgi:hypothetical protein